MPSEKEEAFNFLLIFAGLLVLAGGGVLAYVYKFTAKEREQLWRIRDAAARFGFDPFHFAALIAKESSFNPDAFRREALYKWGTNPDFPEGGDASYGLGQILYSTAKATGYAGEPKGLFDPDTNLEWVGHYLSGLLTLYDGDWKDALAHYNSGRPYNKAPEVTRADYVPKVLAYADQFQKEKIFESIG